jgi:hypothetical protein
VLERPLQHDHAALVGRLLGTACPVRDLELVAYVAGSQPPDFELNLSRGGERPDEHGFWFVLDAALAQEQAVPLVHGRGWAELFEHVSTATARHAARESLAWSERQPAEDEFARLNAARARRYLDRGEWISKEAAR